MGAVGAAILSAPISTTMIVFELTGGYGLSIALLLSASIATGLHQAVHGRSYFHWQLEIRGLVLQEGAHALAGQAGQGEGFHGPRGTRQHTGTL